MGNDISVRECGLVNWANGTLSILHLKARLTNI